jgi:hypothetical protein
MLEAIENDRRESTTSSSSSSHRIPLFSCLPLLEPSTYFCISHPNFRTSHIGETITAKSTLLQPFHAHFGTHHGCAYTPPQTEPGSLIAALLPSQKLTLFVKMEVENATNVAPKRNFQYVMNVSCSVNPVLIRIIRSLTIFMPQNR